MTQVLTALTNAAHAINAFEDVLRESNVERIEWIKAPSDGRTVVVVKTPTSTTTGESLLVCLRALHVNACRCPACDSARAEAVLSLKGTP